MKKLSKLCDYYVDIRKKFSNMKVKIVTLYVIVFI